MTDYSTSVTFTGHRHIPIQRCNEVCAKLEKAVMANYANGVRNFNCGMALGFDLIAAEAVLKVKTQHPDIALTAVVPFRGQCEARITRSIFNEPTIVTADINFSLL